jgi:hypothetical protein
MNNKIDKHVEALCLFNEKANEMKDSSYVKFFLENKPKTTISKNQEDDIKIKTIEPNDESLKSFVLTLRLFLQNNDQISINNINEIYKKLPKNFQKEKESFSRARAKINHILDSNINFIDNNNIMTYRDVLNIFIYGHLAHLKNDKRKIYKDWISRKNIGVLDIYKTNFHCISNNLIRCILHMQKINAEAIKKINDEKKSKWVRY